MSDHTLEPASTLIVGCTGSGKTTFALRYLLNRRDCACRFIFDDLGRAASRLNVTPQYSANELEAALPSRWVIFNPHRMFPGDTKAAFKFFCAWLYEVSKRGPGKKLFLADEVWQWQDPHSLPRELATVVQAGREEHLELVCATQLPHKVHAAITGQCTELVSFRLNEPLALAKVTELTGQGSYITDAPAVQALKLGHFIAWNRISGGRITGHLW